MPRRLSSRERVLTAFAHREPDHVPCWLGASPEWKALARRYLGLPDDESLHVYLGDDFRRVYSRYMGPPATHPTANLSHPEATYRTPFGVERHGYGYGGQGPCFLVYSLLTSRRFTHDQSHCTF